MQGIFTKGLQEWFERNQFQIGISTEDIDQKKESFGNFTTKFKAFEKLAKAVGVATGALKLAERFPKLGPLGGAMGVVGGVLTLSDFLVDTGATVDDLYNALKPYASRADLFG